MEFSSEGAFVFLRVDAGEELVACLRSLASELSIETATIVSGVGMLNGARLGFFSATQDKYDETAFDGIYDLSSVHGNITRMNGKPHPHVHVTFNDSQHVTYSGHVMQATCHLTMELWLLRLDFLKLQRQAVEGRPSSRIVKLQR
jgi:predicted DNA-binding protein with PD1-like motif